LKVGIHTVIFDLDGTLIDSAPSILRSIQSAIDETGIKTIKPLSENLIGPPLKDIFINLVGESNKEKLPELIEVFKRNYDESGYKETRVYEAITEMLDELLKNRLNLYIATNKRLVPTLKIIEHLRWTNKFKNVYALDYFEPVLQNKVEMLRRLHKDLPQASNGAIYIGDLLEDAVAAERSGLPFFMADWGYSENNSIPKDLTRILHPSMLTNKILNYRHKKR
jgi:phosphoglycolate phosphatase